MPKGAQELWTDLKESLLQRPIVSSQLFVYMFVYIFFCLHFVCLQISDERLLQR